MALSRFLLAESPRPRTESRAAPVGNIIAGGDLGQRTSQNFNRLQNELYRPPLIFQGTNWKAWPGDMEGRALLAVTLLSRATGHEPTYFASMVAAYPDQLNRQGYFGPLLDLHAINEQQLSGHGWYLRGLCEYYEYQRRPETLAQIRTIIRNLALPLRGSYAIYPIDPILRTAASRTEGVDGHLAGQNGNWIISTDTCCAFIFLDGLTHAWTILRSVSDPSAPSLKSLIDEAIARFLQVDLVALQAQTHATLTALRAMLRVYAVTADHKLLQSVEDRYALYRAVAMTEHYANYNWFGRPETWTEPCAIIDSFIIATELWQFTGDVPYLEDAHLIWSNGIGRGLRANGGFGTDLCAGYKTPVLKVRSYEAYFCCTMRGGEGHARAAQYLYSLRSATHGPFELTVPFFSDSEAKLDTGQGLLNLRQTASYPNPGPVRIDVLSSAVRSPMTLRLFTPRWTSEHRLTLNDRVLPTISAHGFLTATLTPKSGDVLILEHEFKIGPRETLNPKSIAGYHAFEAGPLLLGHEGDLEIHLPRNAKLVAAGPGRYRVDSTEITLARINDLNESTGTLKDPFARQILFREA